MILLSDSSAVLPRTISALSAGIALPTPTDTIPAECIASIPASASSIPTHSELFRPRETDFSPHIEKGEQLPVFSVLRNYAKMRLSRRKRY